MPRELKKLPFTPDLLPDMQGFYCGDERWEQELSNWIKNASPDGVIDALNHGSKVWLYMTEEDGLVGFGSLAQTRWKWPQSHSPRAQISLIPALAIQKKFWGQPRSEAERRFSDQLLDDLIFEAVQCRDRLPLLGLYVDPANVRAIRVYDRAGFTSFHHTYHDDKTGITYQGMLLDLRGPNEEV